MILEDIIYIRDLKKILPYKKTATIRNWCRRNSVPVFGNKDCKRQFVLAEQFRHAQLQEKIKLLKEKLGDNWVDALKSDMKLYAMHKALLAEIQNTHADSPSVKQRVNPKGKIEQRFLNDINNLLSGQNLKSTLPSQR